MKIKMITLAAGPHGVKQPGKVYDVNADEAKQLVSGNYAEYVDTLPAETKEPVDNSNDQETVLPTVEVFADLKADEQKDLLANLQIEGDDSNPEKRTALYATYMESKSAPAGE